MADEEKGTSAWYKVPTWDGSPVTWRSFKREMDWWLCSLDLTGTMKYNLAARWLLRQTGVVRQRGEEFTPKELECVHEVRAIDPQSGEEVILTEADPLAGINNCWRHWRASMERQSWTRRANYVINSTKSCGVAPGNGCRSFVQGFACWWRISGWRV